MDRSSCTMTFAGALSLAALAPSLLAAQFPPRAAYQHPFVIDTLRPSNSDHSPIRMPGWWLDASSGASIDLFTSYIGTAPPVDTYGVPIYLTLQVHSVREAGYSTAHMNTPYFIGNQDTTLTLVTDGGHQIALYPTRWYMGAELIPGDAAHEKVIEVYGYSIGMEEWLRVVNATRLEIVKGPIHGLIVDRPHFDALKDFTSRLRRAP